MAKAAAMVTELFEPDFVDINFGCPVKKVVKNNGGSGCLKDMTLVRGIIRAVREATRLPVTVKIRSGWDESQRDPVEIGLRCQEAGAQALTLHPRTRTQMYQGAANWDEIARLTRRSRSRSSAMATSALPKTWWRCETTPGAPAS